MMENNGCESCEHCIPIGEGDFFCDEFEILCIQNYESVEYGKDTCELYETI